MGRQIGPLLMAMVASALASCGERDDDVPVEWEDPQISKARLIERGDAICMRDQARASAQLSRLPKRRRSVAIGALIAPILQVNERAIRAGTERLAALGTPDSDSRLLDEFLDERTTAANALGTAVAAAKREDIAELEGALRTYNRNQAQAAATRFDSRCAASGRDG